MNTHFTFTPLPGTSLVMAAAAAGLLCAAPALAQTRAALVQSIDEPARNPYQERAFNNNCVGTPICSFRFATVPAGKRLVITHVNGFIDAAGRALPNGALRSGFGESQFAQLYFSGVPTSYDGADTRIVFNQSILAYFGPGEPVTANYALSGGAEFFAGAGFLTLSGYYIQLP